jgi:Family of unknown function (DUF5677)
VQQQKRWAHRSTLLLRKLLFHLNPIMDQPHLDPEVSDTVGMILDAASRSTESALLLMSYGKLWDAEVIVRSAFEASIKFIYLLQDGAELAHRHEEFAEHQFHIATMKDDQKARDALTSVPDSSGAQWDGVRALLIPDEEREHLRATYDKPTRRSIETRWGYTALLDALVKSGDPAYSTLGGLFYGYTFSSHLHHADYVGISVALGHRRLESPLRDKTDLQRLSRLIRDCFTCFELRLGAVCRFIQADTQVLSRARQQIDELCADMTKSNQAWLARVHAAHDG